MSVLKKLGKLKTLCVIPAKAGSKRLPRKNIRKLAGVSLLERTIGIAKKTNIFDRIFVSTEDQEIAALTQSSGIDIPFMRPAYLAGDPAGVVDVCIHVLDELNMRGEEYDLLVILLPTSPFVHAQDILGALESYFRLHVKFLMSVVRETHSSLTSLVMQDENLLPLHPDWIKNTGSRSSILPELVRANGAITIVDVREFRTRKDYYAYPLGAYVMPPERSIDIDTEYDFLFAEFMAERFPELLDS